MTVKLLVDRPIDGKEYKAGNLCDTDDSTEAGLISSKLAIADLTGGTAYVAPTVQQQVLPVTATTNLTGEFELLGAINQLPGKIPTDVPIMYFRPHGELTTFQVPSPYELLPNPYVIHPSICYVPSGFGEARYWMAYTPLNSNNSEYENPCIVCADHVEGPWRTPRLVNPLATSSNPGTVYNRDAHLYYDKKTKTMVLMWNCKGENSNNTLKLRTSIDGINWTEEVAIWSGSQNTSDMASPSLWYNSAAEKWVCLGHNVVDAARSVRMITSSDLLIGWDAEPTVVTFPALSGRKWWHSWFTVLESGRVVGVAMDNDGGVGSPGYVYVCQSIDGGMSIESAWIAGSSNAELYRPTALFLEREGNIEVAVIHSKLSTNFFYLQKLRSLESRTYEDESAVVGGLLSHASRAKSRAILIADDFNRADSNTGLGVTLDGKTWVQNNGANLVGILNGMTYPATPAGNDIATIDVGVPNYNVYAVMGVSGALSAWLLVNFNNDSNFIRVGISSSRLVIQQYKNTKVYEVIWDSTHPIRQIVILPGDIVRVCVSGSSVRLYVNGGIVHEVDSICVPGYNKVGVQTNGASGYTQWDGIVVTRF